MHLKRLVDLAPMLPFIILSYVFQCERNYASISYFIFFSSVQSRNYNSYSQSYVQKVNLVSVLYMRKICNRLIHHLIRQQSDLILSDRINVNINITISVQAQSAYPPYVAGRNFMEAGWNSVKSNLGVTMIANWTCWPSKLNGMECAQLDKMHCTALHCSSRYR